MAQRFCNDLRERLCIFGIWWQSRKYRGVIEVSLIFERYMQSKDAKAAKAAAKADKKRSNQAKATASRKSTADTFEMKSPKTTREHSSSQKFPTQSEPEFYACDRSTSFDLFGPSPGLAEDEISQIVDEQSKNRSR